MQKQFVLKIDHIAYRNYY